MLFYQMLSIFLQEYIVSILLSRFQVWDIKKSHDRCCIDTEMTHHCLHMLNFQKVTTSYISIHAT